MEDTTILPKSNPRSPFHSRIPNKSQPTEIISRRFELWRKVIKSLVVYYKTIIISNNQFSLINSNVANSFDFSFFTNLKDGSASTGHTPATSPAPHNHAPVNNNPRLLKPNGSVEVVDPSPEDKNKQSFFAQFGNGSIQDVQVLLKKYHLNLATHQRSIALELQDMVIPRLEDLSKDLSMKVKEIKELNNDFKQSVSKDIAATGQFLDDYMNAVKNLQAGKGLSLDPYLLRLKLEGQIKRQLNQENYLEQAFINLQNTSMELEKIVFKEIQDSLNKYCEMISQEIFVHYNDLINELHEGLISRKPYFEWDEFIKRDDGKNFLKLKHDDNIPKARKIADLVYPFNQSIISKTIRSGYLHKKSKLLKSYSKGYYILTLNYLHEFKSGDLVKHGLNPVSSIKLDHCILVDSTENKFQLKVKENIPGKSSVTLVFKNLDLSETEFKRWIIDLKSLTSFDTFQERYDFLSAKLSAKKASSNSSSNSLSAINSNQGQIISRAQTPHLEISNPMDLSSFNSKLESLQSSFNKVSFTSTKNKQTSTPAFNFPKPQPLTSNTTTTTNSSRNSSQSSLKVNIPPPTLEIQEPTPVRPDAPILPSQSSLGSTNQAYNEAGIERSNTPMIGGIALTEENEELIKRIQLNQSLYSDSNNQVDLDKIMNSIH